MFAFPIKVWNPVCAVQGNCRNYGLSSEVAVININFHFYSLLYCLSY
jgi:hypothetical protein